ncbi:hypothetical protein [Fervidobacterium sp.]
MKVFKTGTFVKTYKVILPLLIIFAISTILLIYSINGLKDAFEKLESARVSLNIKSCIQKGIKLVFESSIESITPNVNSEIELIQLRVFSESGDYIGTWTMDSSIAKNFTFSISSVNINDKLRNRKVSVNGFAKVKLDIGKYGLRINLPIQTEVIVSGER